MNATTVADDKLMIRFVQPTTPLSINAVEHWAQARRRTRPWFQVVEWMLANKDLGPFGQIPIQVAVTLEFRTATRRDPHNYTSTVVKAIVDGLVAARVIPDDTAQWATIEDPELVVNRDKTRPLVATIKITKRATP